MGESVTPKINEAVFLLEKLSPETLNEIKSEYPSLSDELISYGTGGVKEREEALDLDRAKVILRALEKGRLSTEKELMLVRKRIRDARRYRLWAQTASLVCSSGVLASIPLRQDLLTIILALLAFLSALGITVAEHRERLLKAGEGDIYQIYELASQLAYKAGLLCEELRLLIKHKANGADLKTAIANGNGLCYEMAQVIPRMSVGNEEVTPQFRPAS